MITIRRAGESNCRDMNTGEESREGIKRKDGPRSSKEI